VTVRALSVRQPWASLIAEGQKRIEVRSWATDHRGDLLICAAKCPIDVCDCPPGVLIDLTAPLGCAICLVELKDVRPLCKRDALPGCFLADEIDVTGLFAWCLRNVRAVEQRPIRGQLELFSVEWD